MKYNLGSGNNHFEGYLGVDLIDKEAHINADISDFLVEQNDNSVDGYVMFQTLEHIPYHIAPVMLKEIYRTLKKGACIWIETPDIGYIAQRIVDTNDINDNTIFNLHGEYHRPWDTGRYEDADLVKTNVHYNSFNFTRMKKFLVEAGFTDIKHITDTNKKYSKYDECLSVVATK